MLVPTIGKLGPRWVILVLVALLACTSISDSNRDTTLRCIDCVEVDVDRVIDGDTLDTSQGRVRLFGVDTPERGEACFSEATNMLRSLAGNIVRLEDGPRTTDSFGRRLAYVYNSNGVSIDETLIREGLGTAWTRDGQHRDLLVNSERDARRQGSGCLW